MLDTVEWASRFRVPRVLSKASAKRVWTSFPAATATP
jgi:hypothetical protein